MEWTDETPTVDGWYWVANADGSDAELANVCIDMCDEASIRYWQSVQSYFLPLNGVCWCGPIEPPEFRKPE